MHEEINKFKLKYYDEILCLAKDSGYCFLTMKEFVEAGFYPEKICVLRHDLDAKPKTLQKMLMIEQANEVRSTIFVRMTGQYNPFNYETYPAIRLAERIGSEIGLHTNPVEFALLHAEEPMDQLIRELNVLKELVEKKISGVACHRDVNFTYNSLPWLQENWEEIKERTGLEYEAYEHGFSSAMYINEGLKPHLCWRNRIPEEAIEMGRSFVLLTHSHWWHDKHPYEDWQL